VEKLCKLIECEPQWFTGIPHMKKILVSTEGQGGRYAEKSTLYLADLEPHSF
jgi:hypothetical protein